ncbi:MAG: hypothetical protein MIO92_15585, partial [Methanosarcinaceae archaeon]|nr:hypothetical protein [Methanosarcinaceae archaeon]
ARLMEIVVDPNDAEGIAILIQGAIEASIKKDCHVIRCISTPGNETHFRRERFYHFPQWDIRFFGTVNSDRIPIERIQDPSLWMLTYGDSF